MPIFRRPCCAPWSVAGICRELAQEKSLKSTIDDVVKQCVDVVHRFPADKSDLSFFKKFDAFYNSAAGRVENNAFLDGDLPALYQFNKCMASQGFPLK